MQAVAAFEEFASQINANLSYKQTLLNYEGLYNLKKFKFTDISTDSAILMFRNIVDKYIKPYQFYKGYGPCQSGTWFENQLRLFLWVLICYIELYRKKLSHMKEEDWNFFAKIFYVKEKNLFEYQAKSLLDDLKQKWQNQEDNLLYTIIRQDSTAKWNQVAKELFQCSNKKYLRTSKQCRERWLNHLDPNKTKCQWNLREYLILFDQVEKKGKKWSLVVKALDNRRSQHSIKNKYNSIMRKQKKFSADLSQSQICSYLIQKISKMSQSNEYCPNEDTLFGSTVTVKQINQNNNQNRQNLEKVVLRKKTEDDIEESKKKFQNFRKKITTLQLPQRQVCSNLLNTPRRIIRKSIEVHSPPVKQQQSDKVMENEIFYDDSFENVLMRPHQNHLLFAEDLKNLIKQCDL